MKYKIMYVVGARPNFMKVAPIIKQLKKDHKFNQILVHTGQHYSEEMSFLFFEQLRLPKPDVNLEVGSCSHATQTAEIMKRFEPVLMDYSPDVLVLVGDVNSTLACALVASKIIYSKSVKRKRPLIAHVEAGLRSFDRQMPEEINRIVTDHLSDILFATEEDAVCNLIKEGISTKKVFLVGNVMIDTLFSHLKHAEKSTILKRLGLSKNGQIEPFAVLTLHRPSNVDEKQKLREILSGIKEVSKRLPIIFPVHPRTQLRISQNRFFSFFDSYLQNDQLILSKGLYGIPPLGYLDFLALLSKAKLILTDSGGIQEESTVLGVPCVTIRDNTERPVTIKEGTNVLTKASKKDIVACSIEQMNKKRDRRVPRLWDGNAATRIIKILKRYL